MSLPSKKEIQRGAASHLCAAYFRDANALAHNLYELERRLGGGLSESERELIRKLSSRIDRDGQILRKLAHRFDRRN